MKQGTSIVIFAILVGLWIAIAFCTAGSKNHSYETGVAVTLLLPLITLMLALSTYHNGKKKSQIAAIFLNLVVFAGVFLYMEYHVSTNDYYVLAADHGKFVQVESGFFNPLARVEYYPKVIQLKDTLRGIRATVEITAPELAVLAQSEFGGYEYLHKYLDTSFQAQVYELALKYNVTKPGCFLCSVEPDDIQLPYVTCTKLIVNSI